MNIKRFSRQTLIAALLLLLLLGGLFSYWLFRPRKQAIPEAKETWMTVLVHGSFGTAMGLFSVFNVIKDNVDDTSYKRMTSHMRHDPFFYHHQAILEPGMHAITPTFEAPKEKNKPAILPLAAAYQEITELTRPRTENQLFYSFGWSGLISQQRRRKEALRFYNMLSKEYNALRQRGILPKIRIIAHSHGGNVALNMAGIHDVLKDGLTTRPSRLTHPDDDQRESMSKIYDMLLNAKKEETISHLPHQKKWDYKPKRASFKIDELILLGTPIQPETSACFLLPFFKKIYSFYSDDDVVQGMDWVSTRRYYSDQRIECSPTGQDAPKLIQAKITLNKPPTPQQQEAMLQAQQQAEAANDEKAPFAQKMFARVGTVWQALFGAKHVRQSLDPNHKELWFMNWKERPDSTTAQRHIKPYPYAIFVPLLQKLLAQNEDACDVDVRIKFKDDKISFMIYEHGDHVKHQKISIPRSVLAELQEKIAPWQPENIAAAHEMNILHRYSKMLNV